MVRDKLAYFSILAIEKLELKKLQPFSAMNDIINAYAERKYHESTYVYITSM